jgi:hypothetical protein
VGLRINHLFVIVPFYFYAEKKKKNDRFAMAAAMRSMGRYLFGATETGLLIPLPTPERSSAQTAASQSAASDIDLMDVFATAPSSSAILDNNANTVAEVTEYVAFQGERVQYRKGGEVDEEPLYEDVARDVESAVGTSVNENGVHETTV